MSNFNQAVEQYQSLISAQAYDQACDFFRRELDSTTLLGIGEPCLRRTGLLEALFVDGCDRMPRLQDSQNQRFALAALAHAYNMIGGYPGKAVPLYRLHVELCEQLGDREGLAEGLANYGKGLRQSGHFRNAEAMGMKGLVLQRETGKQLKEAINLYWVGMGMAHRGVDDGRPEIAMHRAIRICEALLEERSVAIVNSFLAQHYLWLGQPEQALPYVEKAWTKACELEQQNHGNMNEVVMVLSASSRMRAEIAMLTGETALAVEKLNYCLERCQDIEFTEEILPALRVWAELERRRSNFDAARDYLQQTWTLAERGPFPLYHSDSWNTLARIELSEGNRDAAIDALHRAYRLAWCEGPPYAYQRGLEDARQMLQQLSAPLPELPELVDSDYEPIPQVELNPHDEFYQ